MNTPHLSPASPATRDARHTINEEKPIRKDAPWNQSAMASADSVRDTFRMLTYAVAEVKADTMPHVTPAPPWA